MSNKGKNIQKKVPSVYCVWGMLCSFSSIDQERNNISLFNIIEQFNLPAQLFTEQLKQNRPLTIAYEYEIVLLWRRVLDIKISDDEIIKDLKIKTIDSSGKVIQELVVPLKFLKGKKSLRLRIGSPGLTFTRQGDYVLRIEMEGLDDSEFEKMIEIPFLINEVPDGKVLALN